MEPPDTERNTQKGNKQKGNKSLEKGGRNFCNGGKKNEKKNQVQKENKQMRN